MNPLEEKFAQFGHAVSQSAELLSSIVSFGGEEAYFEKTPPKFSLLTNLDIVLGNVADGYSASSLLMEISRLLARQETTKRLAPDVDEWLEQLGLRIDQLNVAFVNQDNDGYVNRLGQIRELVLVMREGLVNEMRNIEFSLNTKFGNVESIADKQLENKYLISRISRLTDKLMLLDFKRLRSMAGDNSDLLLLLPTRLHETIEQCRLSLINSLPRLKHLLWEFEKINKNTKMVWALHHHLRNQSIAYTHTPSDEELQSLQLCSQHDVKPLSTYPNICENRFTNELVAIVHNMKPRQANVVFPEVAPLVETLYSEQIKANEAELDTYMEDKLLELVELAKSNKVSCLKFWQENLSEQTYSAGFLQWAHRMLKDIPELTVISHASSPSEFSGNINIVDFTVEYNNAT